MKEIIEKNRTEINEIYNSKGREKNLKDVNLVLGRIFILKEIMNE